VCRSARSNSLLVKSSAGRGLLLATSTNTNRHDCDIEALKDQRRLRRPLVSPVLEVVCNAHW
jgi:hypothetical protein